MANIGNIVNFFVTWFDESDGYTTSADITDDVIGISFTDTGSGQVNEAIIKLSANFGNFVTSVGTPAVIEQYDRFHVQVEDLSGNSYDHYFEFNPMIVPSQTKTEGTLLELNLIGTEYHTQRIHFAGRFWFSDAFRVARAIGENYNDNRETRQPVLTGHTTGYIQSSGTGNGFPRFTVNHYEYGIVEDTGYNRWVHMLDKLGGSVATGGILDYFEVGFETSAVNAIEVALFSSGSRTVDLSDDANLPTISQSLNVNVGSTEAGIAAATASHVAAWGAQTHGSLPTGHSIYASGADQFIFRPAWDEDTRYLAGSRVEYTGKRHYRALNDITGTPPFTNPASDTTNWQQIDMSDEFGDTVQYSEWTDDRVREWANCGANPSEVNQVGETITPDTSDGKIGASMFDMNIVVLDNAQDAKYFKTWVDFVLRDGAGGVINVNMTNTGSNYTSTPTVSITGGGGGSGATATAIVSDGEVVQVTVDNPGSGYTTDPTVTISGGGGSGATAQASITSGDSISAAADNWAYSGQTNQFPVGRRCLVNGTATGFTGNDSNGVPFTNNIAEWSGEEWIVRYRPAQLSDDLDTMQVVDLDSGVIYQWNDTDSVWETPTGDLGYDCIHQYTSLSSAESYDIKPSITDSANYPFVTKDGNPFATNVFSSIKATYSIQEDFLDRLLAGSSRPIGDFFKKGAWLVWRVPFSPNNYGTGVTIGNLYGTDTPAVGERNLQPSFLDTQNMSFTSRGETGFNTATSEDLGQLQEVVANITVQNQAITGASLDGITTVRCWMIDRYDNTVYYDAEIPFVDTAYTVKIPFSSFKIYRGRKPRFFDLNLPNSPSLVVPQELEIINRFAFREIQMIGWQVQDFYDEFGRYAPDIFGALLDFDISNTGLGKIPGGTVSLTIDDFHFSKPLLAIAKNTSSQQNLEAEFRKRPHIMTYDQLLNDARTELEKEQFQLKEYQIETAGPELFALKFGDGFFFADDRLVDDQDDSTASTSKKIKLVAKHIQYNLTAPGTGEGGFTRTITASKRFT